MNAFKTNQFHLPYHQSDRYWLAVFSEGAGMLLANLGMLPRQGYYVISIEKPWVEKWNEVRKALDQKGILDNSGVALVPSEQEPTVEEFRVTRQSLADFDTLVQCLWLGDALLENRVVCYMQPVIDKRGKVFGYEAFARAEASNGEIIGGGKIIEASRGLNAQYALDRYLHVKAVKSFIESDLEGFLFINFVPGFIHRPEKYLEGLTDTAKFHGMPAKRIVLDFTRSESPSDLTQMKAIFDYCRANGYSLSLDDISSAPLAKKIMDSIRPDFLKLDISLVKGAMDATDQRTIAELVELAHQNGVTVAAEGVESEDIHKELLKAGVDLFQGFFFSPPVAISAIKKAVG